MLKRWGGRKLRKLKMDEDSDLIGSERNLLHLTLYARCEMGV
jgi:hypothetical protein